MNYSLCIEMFFKDSSIHERFSRASESGFSYCEFWRWKGRDWDRIADCAKKAGIGVSAFSGDDEYSMIDPGHSDSYIKFTLESMKKARQIGCPNLVIHSDALNQADGSALDTGRKSSHEMKLLNMHDVLKKLAPAAEEAGITLCLEPLNTLVDHKNYFISDPDSAFEITRSVGSERIKVLYDIYHMQIMKGNVIATIEKNLDQIGYIHAADVPGRHEPGTGELNFRNIFSALKSMGYGGFAGFELSPAFTDEAALDALKKVMV